MSKQPRKPYRKRCYDNSRLKPKQLSPERYQYLRTKPYLNGGDLNHYPGFKLSDRTWWEEQKDCLWQHIDYLQQELDNARRR